MIACGEITDGESVAALAYAGIHLGASPEARAQTLRGAPPSTSRSRAAGR
jgi:hypothetical protein